MLSSIIIIAAYLMGSVSSAIIVCKLMGLPDPRTQGSRNPGATNVLRFGGKKAAIITLLGDTLKGVIPVVIASALDVSPAVLAATGFAAFLGHLYPIFFRFEGGKGVATAFGVLIGLSWPVSLAVLGTWLLMAYVFRYSSLSALTATTLTPVYLWLLNNPQEYVTMALPLCLLLIWRHRSNIKNLLNGTEGKIGQKK